MHCRLRLLLAYSLAALPAGAAVLGDLRCENRTDPLGVQDAHPRLSWTFVGGGGVQKAYQILVATTPEKLNSGDADLWDSGRVASDQTAGVRYAGRPLESRRKCYWKVRAWDAFYQPTVYSSFASWEMGLLSPADWKARWIGSKASWGGRALYFRYPFYAARRVSWGRAYIASSGYSELRVNGAPITARVQQSGPVTYTACDVGGRIRQGNNLLAVIAGDAVQGHPKLLVQLEIIYADGAREQLYTHAGAVNGTVWTVTSGPILSESAAGGEVYDARLEKSGWDDWQPVLPESQEWASVDSTDPPEGGLISQSPQPPIRNVPAQKLAAPRPGVFVFDAGRVLTGWVELHLAGPSGAAITVRGSKSLAADGTLSSPATVGIYILKGGGEETWEPHFFRRRLRYIQVEGFPGIPGPGNVLFKAAEASAAPAARLVDRK